MQFVRKIILQKSKIYILLFSLLNIFILINAKNVLKAHNVFLQGPPPQNKLITNKDWSLDKGNLAEIITPESLLHNSREPEKYTQEINLMQKSENKKQHEKDNNFDQYLAIKLLIDLGKYFIQNGFNASTFASYKRCIAEIKYNLNDYDKDLKCFWNDMKELHLNGSMNELQNKTSLENIFKKLQCKRPESADGTISFCKNILVLNPTILKKNIFMTLSKDIYFGAYNNIKEQKQPFIDSMFSVHRDKLPSTAFEKLNLSSRGSPAFQISSSGLSEIALENVPRNKTSTKPCNGSKNNQNQIPENFENMDANYSKQTVESDRLHNKHISIRENLVEKNGNCKDHKNMDNSRNIQASGNIMNLNLNTFNQTKSIIRQHTHKKITNYPENQMPQRTYRNRNFIPKLNQSEHKPCANETQEIRYNHNPTRRRPIGRLNNYNNIQNFDYKQNVNIRNFNGGVQQRHSQRGIKNKRINGSSPGNGAYGLDYSQFNASQKYNNNLVRSGGSDVFIQNSKPRNDDSLMTKNSKITLLNGDQIEFPGSPSDNLATSEVNVDPKLASKNIVINRKTIYPKSLESQVNRMQVLPGNHEVARIKSKLQSNLPEEIYVHLDQNLNVGRNKTLINRTPQNFNQKTENQVNVNLKNNTKFVNEEYQNPKDAENCEDDFQ